MKNLIKQLEIENRKKVAEFKKELKSTLVSELRNKCKQYAFYRELFTPSKFKLLESMTKKNLVSYLVERFELRMQKQLTEKLDRIKWISMVKDVDSVLISVEYTRSRTWGACPKATVTVNYTDNTRANFESSRITGCGYDKESTAIAEALNQSNGVLRYLYEIKNKRANVRKSNRDVIGYGSGYGILPQFEGGVGVSCMRKICDSIGFEFKHISNGKMFDVYQMVKK